MGVDSHRPPYRVAESGRDPKTLGVDSAQLVEDFVSRVGCVLKIRPAAMSTHRRRSCRAGYTLGDKVAATSLATRSCPASSLGADRYRLRGR